VIVVVETFEAQAAYCHTHDEQKQQNVAFFSFLFAATISIWDVD